MNTANLADIIAQKSQNDEQWRVQKQSERENAVAMQDAGIVEITSNPDYYARYLQLQGDNPSYSAGNIALAMVQNPNIEQFGTKERWKTLGRTVMDVEVNRGIKIFSRSSFGKGYTLADAYDISQTFGREQKQVTLQDNTKAMEGALSTLLNYSVVQVKADPKLDSPAYYDAHSMELSVSPNYPDSVAFPAIATEIAHARFHAKGANYDYNRGDCDLDAQSVSYILCRRFGVETQMPDLSGLTGLYEGWTPMERRSALDSIQDMSKQIGGSIERSITPQQRTRSRTAKPTR